MGLGLKFGLTWRYGEKRGSFTLFHRPFLEAIKNWQPAFEFIAEDVLEPHVLSAIRTEGESEGVTWPQLAPATVKRRGSAHPMLVVTGALENSFIRGGLDHVEVVAPRKLIWGSRSPLALFHQFGTRGRVNFSASGARIAIRKSPGSQVPRPGSSGIPARPMIVYSQVMARQITSAMTGRMAQVARQVGYRIGSRAFSGERLSPVEARMIGQQMLGG